MITIRPYEPPDQAAVWELHHLALQASGARLDDGLWDADLGNIPSIYPENRGCFLVGIREGRLIAMGALKRLDSERAEIKRMRVHPHFQQRGYGTQILQALEREGSRLGYTVLQLDTTTVQADAQKLYEKHGFRKVGSGTVAHFEILFFEKSLISP